LSKGEVLNNFANFTLQKKDWKNKKLSSSKEMGIGEEWKGELWDSASRMSGVKCG
jgi:hypothetical protein